MKRKTKVLFLCITVFLCIGLFNILFRQIHGNFPYGRDTEVYFYNVSVAIGRWPDVDSKSPTASIYKAGLWEYSPPSFSFIKIIEENVSSYYFDKLSDKLYIKGKDNYTVISTDKNKKYEQHKIIEDFSYEDIIIFRTAWFEEPGGLTNKLITVLSILLIFIIAQIPKARKRAL